MLIREKNDDMAADTIARYKNQIVDTVCRSIYTTALTKVQILSLAFPVFTSSFGVNVID